ncbi:MAG: cobalt-precorrin-6A reductase [Alphaproteobacteria bacterium]|nr:cobalt-precorrin-6A reductase [Alphaproteobacteria bacterium]
MQPERILILGGTGLARQAADALVARGAHVVTSLAGVTRTPHLPKGEIRTGGFGGAEGLATYLRNNAFDWVVDATHPFAAQMPVHAALACAAAGVRLLRLEAPAWIAQAGDDWRMAPTIAAAVLALPSQSKAAVTVGRKEIGIFFARADLSGIARMIEPPEQAVPPTWQLLLERPPFSLAAEVDLLRAGNIQFLVSKNAGGPRVAKLDAAAALAIPVIMVQRPAKPVVPTAATVDELLGRLALRG